MLYLYELSLESPRESSPLHERLEEMFDVFFILTISTSMYVAWYGYNAPLGVSRKVHVLAIASATWLTAFFAYYMAAEAPLRPQYHTVLILMWYCAVALTYATLYERGRSEVRNELRDNKSR